MSIRAEVAASIRAACDRDPRSHAKIAEYEAEIASTKAIDFWSLSLEDRDGRACRLEELECLLAAARDELPSSVGCNGL